MGSKRGQTGARREPVFDKSPELHVSADDRTIYYTVHNSETDIWLMTMH